MARAKRKLLNLNKEAAVAKERRIKKALSAYQMYPLNAPGMPPPGPNFLRVARALGDGTVYKETKKKGKPKEIVYEPGHEISQLYSRALREHHFTMQMEARPGQYKSVIFVPGHIWGENFEAWEKSAYDLDVDGPTYGTGPQAADVMVIGKMPWKEETKEGRNLIGASGEVLTSLCHQLHMDGLESWYITNLLKFMPPDGTTDIKASWAHDCLVLLHQELRLVRPRFILLLGSDASKWLLGTKYTVGYMKGRVVPFTFPVHPTRDHEPEMHTAQCMAVLHPVNVVHATGPHEARDLERGLSRWSLLVQGADFTKEEEGLDHRTCTSFEEALEWCQEAKLELSSFSSRARIVAIDAEWEGHHAVNKNAWLATVQVSWAPKKAICFHLRDEDGKVCFKDVHGKPAIKRLARLLTRELNQYRVAGHFFVSDLEMLVAEGLDFRQGFAVPLEDRGDQLAWQRCQAGEGGLDTAMMAHAIEETGFLGLEHLTLRYTTANVYHHAVEEAVLALCKKLGVSRAALEGYGKLPRSILIPYANYDADVTRRIAVELMGYLDSDYDGNNCWEPFWESMIIQPVLLEVHQNGIHVDRKRVDELTVTFIGARSSKETEVKLSAYWPDPPSDNAKAWTAFNIRSVQHVREYLFGEKLNGKVTTSGKVQRIRPPGAISLGVKPIFNTGKPPKLWADIEARNQEREHNPSTGKQSLALMAQAAIEKGDHDIADKINQIRDYRFLDQVLKSVLRPPVEDDKGEWLREEGDGFADQGLLVYDAGLAACIDDDGMVRTHIYPTAETGRWKHARPNLANISKTRDPDYERLLGKENYKHKLRSIFVAPPPTISVPVVKWRAGKKVIEHEKGPWVLIESDLKGAELYGMATMSGSTKMIEHARRSIDYPDFGYSLLGERAPKDHKCPLTKEGKPAKACELCGYPSPEYYDIHSNVAKLAFKLDCHPSKFGMGLLGKAHLRNIAKTVIFGLCYGRGAKAICVAAKEQGVVVTVEEIQAVIESIFAMYPELVPFFAECRDRAIQVGWLCSCFGRLRRFPEAHDFKLEGEFERQAMNYPIQGMIASLVDRWVAILHDARERMLPEIGEHLFQWQLQIHDALLLRVRPQYVDYVATHLLPWSVQRVPVYPTRLDGSPIPGRGPYYLGVDTEVSLRWGERLTVAECESLGVPTKFGKG